MLLALLPSSRLRGDSGISHLPSGDGGGGSTRDQTRSLRGGGAHPVSPQGSARVGSKPRASLPVMATMAGRLWVQWFSSVLLCPQCRSGRVFFCMQTPLTLN